MVPARVQWSHLGERLTKFFWSLEQKHYIEKNVRKIQTEDRHIITDQAHILKEIELFYSKLFQSRDTEISYVDLNIIAFIKKVKRENLSKIWRPMSLLRVFYKLATGTITNRTKNCFF